MNYHHRQVLPIVWISLIPSLSLHPLLLVGPPNYIQYLHRADVSSCWLADTSMSMCRGPLKNVAYEFVFASSAVSCIFFLSYLDGFFLDVECCFQNLFKTVCSILVNLPFNVFSMRFISVHLVHPYNSCSTTTNPILFHWGDQICKRLITCH